MLNLAHIFGDIFCIAMLLVLTGGIISERESQEKNAFLALIFTAMLYILTAIFWQMVESRILIPNLSSTLAYHVFIRILTAELMHASLRYLYLVITGRTPRGVTFWIPVLTVAALSAASCRTGWFFRVEAGGAVVRGSLYWLEYLLTNGFLVITTFMGLATWLRAKTPSGRRRGAIVASFILPLLAVKAMELLNPELRLKSFGIVLAISMVFIRLQKLSVSESIYNLQIQQENATRYRNTLLSTALQFMVVDLTKDLILELTVPRNGDISLESLVRSGRLPSYRYSDTVRIWKENTVGLTQEDSERLFDPKSLLHRYNCGETQFSDTLQIRLASGKVVWCRQDLIMARNSQTRDVVATMTIYDITEQKTREQHYQTQQQVIEALASGVSAYWILDWETEALIDHHTDNDRIIGFNNMILSQPNYSRAIDYVFDSLVDEVSRQEARSALQVDTVRKKLADGNEYVVPMYLSAQGSYYRVSFSQIMVGQRKAFIASARDITDMVSRERNLRRELAHALNVSRIASQAKTDFLLNMSHDIRTPMNAILGFQELAKRNIHDPERMLNALEKSRRSGEHLLSLINDILDMSRIESGKMVMTPEVIDIKEHISRFEDMFRIPMEEKGLTLQVIDETYTPYVFGDYLHLTQVINNLLSNAMKFTPSGGSVTFHAAEEPGDREGMASFRISIRDTGIGMSEEFQSRLFDAFERENSSTVTGVQGTGLGLAICKKLAALMDGELTFTSTQGKGTEFVFAFQLPIADAPSEMPLPDKPSLAGKRILLVEDNELNREIAREILTGDGLIVSEVHNGAEAVAVLQNAQPGDFDAVLMDIQMPVMDGYRATRIIRNLEDPLVAKIPIIAMTADAFTEDKRRALEAGMNAHIPKPVDMDALMDILSDHIR